MRSSHTRQVRCAASSSYDDLDATPSCRRGILSHILRCSVCGCDLDLGLNAKVLENLQAGNQGLQIAVRTHDDANRCTRRREQFLRFGRLSLALCKLDQWLDGSFGLAHRRRRHGDVAHLAARAGVALAVQVDTGIRDGKRPLSDRKVRVWLGAT